MPYTLRQVTLSHGRSGDGGSTATGHQIPAAAITPASGRTACLSAGSPPLCAGGQREGWSPGELNRADGGEVPFLLYAHRDTHQMLLSSRLKSEMTK